MPTLLAKTAIDMSPLALFLAADIVVKLVMLGLVAASIASWAIIVDRGRQLKVINAHAKAFEAWFWKADSVDALYDAAKKAAHPSARLFVAGMDEWRRSILNRRAGAAVDRDGVRARLTSAMGVAIAREIDVLGLFGTVWGIMRAFGAIASSQNTSLGVVAPGIAEALFATALGLFAAIPAVIGYNRLLHGLGRLEARLGAFGEEFHALLSRQLDGMEER
jgi:biopolymer transport protein TolQ